MPYGVGSWDENEYGNHRVLIHVTDKSDAVWVHIPWRRRDLNPEQKNIIVVDGATGSRITNICRVEINREFGDLVFQPQTVPEDYFIYYMPFVSSGRSYPRVTYPKPENTAQDAWLRDHSLTPDGLKDGKWQTLPAAEVLEIQSIDEFNSFSPMEIIATANEVQGLIDRQAGNAFLLFPEDRSNPIRMTDDLPYKWIREGVKNTFKGFAARGEYYTFQIGVFAVNKTIEDIVVEFGDLKSSNGSTMITPSEMTCFNTDGINWDGRKFDKLCPVDRGKVQALWCGIQIPEDASPGEYTGQVTVTPKNMEGQAITVKLTVTNELLKDAGDGDPGRHSRLRWLNSRIAFDDEIVSPFIPVAVENNSVSCLGRTVTLGNSGLPVSIKSMFAPEMTHLIEKGRDILSSPVRLVVKTSDDKEIHWRSQGVTITKQGPGTVNWSAKSIADNFTLDCSALMEFDGFVQFNLALNVSDNRNVKDIWLEIPLNKDAARYMMGLGLKGGYRPSSHKWQWDVTKHQEGAWIGDVNAGLQFTLRDTNYSRPLNTNFYQSKPLNLPVSWYNEGNGGCDIIETSGNTVLIKAYSGNRSILAGETLHFNFNLLLTPFKILDTAGQWSTRFYHRFSSIDEVVKSGANTVNVHHANDVNPYINYPFIHQEQMRAYIEEGHAKGLKIKIYNTIRELSNRAPEIFALRSLGTEIYSDGPGGGFSWLQEHIGSEYIAAWFVPRLKDAAIINSGMSRWHNYYLEGLNWLALNMEIDGLYIDDVAFDRTTMKRVRKILDRHREGAVIDLHSANQYNNRDGFTNSANLYLEHFPYINRLWFGEYFDYDSAPDFWLVEVSGIPFGLMGEMLQGGGNLWRGMIYGMTNRLPYGENDPRPVWKVWDDFGIQDSRMVGYWSPACPVKTNNKDVLATAYIKEGETLVSLASWAESKVECRLLIDWDSIGIDPYTAQAVAPAVKDFQEAAVFDLSDAIPIEPGKGWLLIIGSQ
ncbi:glycoside hydrolase domain-containing protein [candidate division KSB1 bacterium]